MSFTAADLHRWLDDAALSVEVRCADGTTAPDAESLARLDIDLATLDSRRAGPGVLFVGVPGERTHGALYLESALRAGAPAAVVEGEAPRVAGFSQPVFEVSDGRAALRALARYYLATFNPVVLGITGSNGKTTTKDFLRTALRDTHRVGANPGNLNSGWGLPLAVLSQRGNEDMLVLEMGASAPGEIARLVELTHPRVGCITNIAPAHLEGFGSLQGVIDTKAALVEGLPSDGLAVLWREDECFEVLRERSAARRCVTFGRHARADVRLDECRQEAEGLQLTIDGHRQSLPVFGEANGLNAAAACAMAAEMGVSIPDALARMTHATLSPHRSRLMAREGRAILDDCYNANPASMRASLRSLAAMPVSGRRIAVLGSMFELGEASDALHRAVLEEAQGLDLAVVAVGDPMASHARAASGLDLWNDLPHELAEMGRALARRSEKGDALLFKASRSVGLEAVLEAMLAELEAETREMS